MEKRHDQAAPPGPDTAEEAPPAGRAQRTVKNNVRKMRTERMMSKAELARRAGMSVLTIDRVERGLPCRMDTKRKILEALGLSPTDRVAVFGDVED
jgi:DNA-binding XRE family transcriptional regulator